MNQFAGASRRSIAVVTGTRAEYGLLRSIVRAIQSRPDLSLQVIVTGTHLLPPARTIEEVASEFEVNAVVEMQDADCCTRLQDAMALGRGISGLAAALSTLQSDLVLVLGDRIEAFAAAAAAAVSGIRVAHVHGGDRAEGIADESLRHAISKLAHVHLPATETSAQRLIAMGEEPARIHVIGSPAIDDVAGTPPLDDEALASLGSPQIVFLLHPTGEDDRIERERASRLLNIAAKHGRLLALHPNHDPGRQGIVQAIEASGHSQRAHLQRTQFIGLLRRVKVLVGNSSAGLIEAAAIPTWCVNVGRRQSGRERASNVLDTGNWDYETIDESIRRAMSESLEAVTHPYGDGCAGQRTAYLLATLDWASYPLAKQNAY